MALCPGHQAGGSTKREAHRPGLPWAHLPVPLAVVLTQLSCIPSDLGFPPAPSRLL